MATIQYQPDICNLLFVEDEPTDRLPRSVGVFVSDINAEGMEVIENVLASLELAMSDEDASVRTRLAEENERLKDAVKHDEERIKQMWGWLHTEHENVKRLEEERAHLYERLTYQA
jgi:hypothetical protein